MSRPLRILQVAAMGFPSDQGSQVYVGGMCRALAARGHQVSLACYGHGRGDVDGSFRVIRAPRIPKYDRLRAGPDLVKPWLDLWLAGRLGLESADVIHAHNYEAPIAALIGRRRRRIPLFYSAHTLLEQELPTYFETPRACRIAERLGGRLDRTIPRLADHAIALSEGTAARLEALGCESVSVHEPGVDPREFPPTAPLCRDGPWVIYAGNPDRYQDLDVLYQAMKQVRGAGLLLVGGSPFPGVQGMGLKRLRVVQASDFNQIRGWLSSALLAVIPRSVCAGYPIKLLNYLGMGLPTVVARASARALPGVISVPNRSPAALARAIQNRVDDPAGTAALGALARRHILNECSWDYRAKEIERLYWTFLDRLGLGHDLRKVRQCVSQGYADSVRTRHCSA